MKKIYNSFLAEEKIKNAEGKIKKIIKHEKDTVVGTFQWKHCF